MNLEKAKTDFEMRDKLLIEVVAKLELSPVDDEELWASRAFRFVDALMAQREERNS